MNKEDKEELLKEIDRRLELLRKEFIASLDDKKEFELTYPEDDEIVFYIDSDDGEIYDTPYFANSAIDIYMFEHGLYFDLKSEAKHFLKERKLLFKLHQWAREKNGGWEPDWSDVSQYKYSVDYSGLLDELYATDATVQKRFNKLPFFKSEKIAKECIDLFGDEIKEVLVNGS